jgi:hypothetical protein
VLQALLGSEFTATIPVRAGKRSGSCAPLRLYISDAGAIIGVHRIEFHDILSRK